MYIFFCLSNVWSMRRGRKMNRKDKKKKKNECQRRGYNSGLADIVYCMMVTCLKF